MSEWVLPDGHALAGLAPGDTLDLLGPCGSAWQVRPDLNLLLIGAQPERLLFLAQAAVTARCAVTWWWPEAVPAWAPGLLPAAVELQRGPLTRDLARWADGVLCDVAPPDLTSLAHRLREWGGPKPAGFVQALCVPSFPCGVGACQACWVETRHGRRLACLEGPVLAIG